MTVSQSEWFGIDSSVALDGLKSLILLLAMVIARSLIVRWIAHNPTLSMESKRRWVVTTRNSVVFSFLIGLVIIWAHELQALAVIVPIQGVILGNFGQTRLAPGPPEIEDRDLAPEIAGLQNLPADEPDLHAGERPCLRGRRRRGCRGDRWWTAERRRELVSRERVLEPRAADEIGTAVLEQQAGDVSIALQALRFEGQAHGVIIDGVIIEGGAASWPISAMVD